MTQHCTQSPVDSVTQPSEWKIWNLEVELEKESLRQYRDSRTNFTLTQSSDCGLIFSEPRCPTIELKISTAGAS